MGYFHDNYGISMILPQARRAVFSASSSDIDGNLMDFEDTQEAGLRGPAKTQPLQVNSRAVTALLTILEQWCAQIACATRAMSALSHPRTSRYWSDDCSSRSARSVKATHTTTVNRTIKSPESELKFDVSISIPKKRFKPQSPPRRKSERKIKKQQR